MPTVSEARALMLITAAGIPATLVVFAFSRIYRNSSFYDAYWRVGPPLLLFHWWSQSGPGPVAGVVAVRRGGAIPAMFLGAGIPMMGERSLVRRSGYRDIIAQVPRFVPRPPRKVLR